MDLRAETLTASNATVVRPVVPYNLHGRSPLWPSQRLRNGTRRVSAADGRAAASGRRLPELAREFGPTPWTIALWVKRADRGTRITRASTTRSMRFRVTIAITWRCTKARPCRKLIDLCRHQRI